MAAAMALNLQAPAAATPAPIGELRACRALTDAAARLTCFDRAAAALDQAVASREVVVLDRNEVRKTRRSLFGFSLPRIGLFGPSGDEAEEEAEREVEAAIAGSTSLGYGKWRIRMTDGAVWQTTEALRGFRSPASGMTVKIKRGALGNYFMEIPGNRSVTVKRES